MDPSSLYGELYLKKEMLKQQMRLNTKPVNHHQVPSYQRFHLPPKAFLSRRKETPLKQVTARNRTIRQPKRNTYLRNTKHPPLPNS